LTFIKLSKVHLEITFCIYPKGERGFIELVFGSSYILYNATGREEIISPGQDADHKINRSAAIRGSANVLL
jgi:hypothetical protein